MLASAGGKHHRRYIDPVMPNFSDTRRPRQKLASFHHVRRPLIRYRCIDQMERVREPSISVCFRRICLVLAGRTGWIWGSACQRDLLMKRQ